MNQDTQLAALTKSVSALTTQVGNLGASVKLIAEAVDAGEVRLDEVERMLHRLRYAIINSLAPAAAKSGVHNHLPAEEFHTALSSLREENRRAGRPHRVFSVDEIHARAARLKVETVVVEPGPVRNMGPTCVVSADGKCTINGACCTDPESLDGTINPK